MKRLGAILLAVVLLAGCAGGGTPAAAENGAAKNGAAEAGKEAVVGSDSLYVEKIDALPEGFFLGADVSSLLAEEQSGVVYKGFDGQPADMLKVLSDAGVNCVRVRV